MYTVVRSARQKGAKKVRHHLEKSPRTPKTSITQLPHGRTSTYAQKHLRLNKSTYRPSNDVLVGRLELHRTNHLATSLTWLFPLHPCEYWIILGRTDRPTTYSLLSYNYQLLSYSNHPCFHALLQFRAWIEPGRALTTSTNYLQRLM